MEKILLASMTIHLSLSWPFGSPPTTSGHGNANHWSVSFETRKPNSINAVVRWSTSSTINLTAAGLQKPTALVIPLLFTNQDKDKLFSLSQRLDSPGIHPSQFQLEAEFEKDIMEIAGVNPELFGMADNDKVETAGILSKMRQAAGLVNLQDIFDNLRESQKLLGRKVLKLIQLNYTPEKVKLITKKEPTPEFYSKTFSKYDIAIDEGLLTDTQKQSEFVQLNALKAMGVQISDEELIDASNLHNKKKIKDRIAAQTQAAQQQEQMQVQLAMQNQQVLTDAAESKAMSDRALAAERTAKIQLDQALNAERISRAEEDRTAGVLNLVKAVKELEGIDLQMLTQKLQLLMQIEGHQVSKEQVASAQSTAQAAPSQAQTQKPSVAPQSA